MSWSLSNKNILKNIETNKKLSNNILYSEENEASEFFELMRNGYKEMSKINLELAYDTNSSQKSLKYKFDDINEYEKWLCGV